MRVVWDVGRQLGRARPNRPAALISVVVAAFVMFMFVALQAFSPSTEQALARDFGDHEAFVGFGVLSGGVGDATPAEALAAAVVGVDADATTVLVVPDLEVLSPRGSVQVTARETTWDREPFPGVLELVDGRWPVAPGEVVVTRHDDLGIAVGDVIPALAGRAPLQVVGTAVDRSGDPASLLLGPGTWAGLDPALAPSWPDLRATSVMYWDGSSRDEVIEAVAAAVPQPDGGGRRAVKEVARSYDDRQQAADDYPAQWIRRSPAGYAVPSLLLPLAGALLAFLAVGHRARRAVRIMVDVGLARGVAVAAFAASVAVWSLAGAVVGAAGGWMLGAVFYELIELVRIPESPTLPGVVDPLARTFVGVLAGSCLGTAMLLRDATDRRGVRPRRRVRGLRGVRLGLLGLLTVVAVWQASAVASANDTARFGAVLAGLVAVGVALCTPEIVGLLVRRLPGSGPQDTLARRRLGADRARTSGAVAFLATTVGLSAGFVVLLSTMISTVDSGRHPDALPGQLLVTDPASVVLPVPPASLETIARVDRLRGGAAVQLSHAMSLRGDEADEVVTAGESLGTLLVVDTVTDVERVFDVRLTRRQRDILRRDGLLVWRDSDLAGSAPATRLTVRAQDGTKRTVTDVPVADVDVPPVGWRDGDSGLLLTGAARRLGLPISRGAVVHVGVPGGAITEVHDVVRRDGLDPASVVSYEEPPAAVPPAALVTTAGGLLVVALLVNVATSRAQVRAVRRDAAAMLAIGLPRRWGRRVLMYQQAFVVATGLVLGLFVAVVPVLVTTHMRHPLVLEVPWAQVGLLLGCLAAATMAAGLHAARAVTAQERNG